MNKEDLILDELKEIKHQLNEVRKDIQDSVVPKSVTIKTKDLVEHAIELWRLENRINSVLSDSKSEINEIILNTIEKLKRYLDKNDIEIIDYTNQKYTESLNVEVLAFEEDKKIEESIIKETKEPSITLKGQIISKGKVIVLMNKNTQEVQK